MRFEHRFSVCAPMEAVVHFHSRSASMAAVTPPPLIVRMHGAPERLGEGDEMDFTLWVGPLPIRWTARIEGLSPDGFIDRQLRGPFARWSHRHHFVPLGDGSTEVVDQVEAVLKTHLLWGPVGLAMWIGLPLLFAFRGWKTRRMLTRQQPNEVPGRA